MTIITLEDIADTLRTAVSEHTAAILLEPIQGESGIHPLTDAFLADHADALAGFARTKEVPEYDAYVRLYQGVEPPREPNKGPTRSLGNKEAVHHRRAIGREAWAGAVARPARAPR